MNIKRGHVYLAALNPTVGSEIKKTRPVLVVSNNSNNSFNSTVCILSITSNTARSFLFEVVVNEGTANLPKKSKIKADQIRTIDKSRIIRHKAKCRTKLSLKSNRQFVFILH
ncbi:MAG: type II toxin-antitoxin system PemK/MazF family toxin [Chitinophagales bacterium]|nr:type II toxin-antitoxin system PemK/MazF family toxin [Chitinophagales bacterium]